MTDVPEAARIRRAAYAATRYLEAGCGVAIPLQKMLDVAAIFAGHKRWHDYNAFLARQPTQSQSPTASPPARPPSPRVNPEAALVATGAPLTQMVQWCAKAGSTELLFGTRLAPCMTLPNALGRQRLPGYDAQAPFSTYQVLALLEGLPQQPDWSELSGYPVRFFETGYDLQSEDGQVYPIRITITAQKMLSSATTLSLTAVVHLLPTRIPYLEELDLQEEFLEHAFPTTGMVLLTGPTRSGLTTFQYSLMTKIKQNPASKLVAVERYQHYDLKAVSGPGLVYQNIYGPVQGEMGEEINLGILRALQADPSHLMVGPLLGRAFFDRIQLAAQSGHAVYASMKANSLKQAIRLMTAHREVLNETRLIACQRLVPGTNGSLVALREFVGIPRSLSQQLRSLQEQDVVKLLSDQAITRKCTFQNNAMRHLQAKRISQGVYEDVLRWT